MTVAKRKKAHLLSQVHAALPLQAHVVRGSWFVVRGWWSEVRCSWSEVRGSWFVTCGSWFVV